jgi:co-chaperonin GroES (HSP10)
MDAAGKHVLVRLVQEEKSKGGIILPQTDSTYEKMYRGKVVSVGPCVMGHFLEEGDVVMFAFPVIDDPFSKDGAKYMFVLDENILGVE